MNTLKKTTFYILDTSAILSGKPINFENIKMFTTPGVSMEIKPGGRDYQIFELLKEKGLNIIIPKQESMDEINKKSVETGDINRLSNTDKEILALALEFKKQKNDVVILTDDYSIQNVASFLKIKYENINQKGITKTFKWTYKCSGCGKKYKENIKTCPICGAPTRNIISNKKNI